MTHPTATHAAQLTAVLAHAHTNGWPPPNHAAITNNGDIALEFNTPGDVEQWANNTAPTVTFTRNGTHYKGAITTILDIPVQIYAPHLEIAS